MLNMHPEENKVSKVGWGIKGAHGSYEPITYVLLPHMWHYAHLIFVQGHSSSGSFGFELAPTS